MSFNLSCTAQDLNAAVTKANAAAPQSTTYTKAEVDAKIPAPVTVDQTYNAQSANAQSGVAVAQAIGNVPYTLKRVLTGRYTYTWDTTNRSDRAIMNYDNNICPFETGKMYLVVLTNYDSNYTETYGTQCSGVMVGAPLGGGTVSFTIKYYPGDWTYTFGNLQFEYFPSFATLNWTLPARTDSQLAENTYGQVDVYEISNVLLNDGISATDYATQTTGGTVKAWTTTDGSDTILHLATQ